MASIEEYLQAINDAVYGEEVRGSIHDAISAMNDESEHAVNVAETSRDSAAHYAQEGLNTLNDTRSVYDDTVNIRQQEQADVVQFHSDARNQYEEYYAQIMADADDKISKAKAWAVGPGYDETSEGTDQNNAKAWYTKTKDIAEGILDGFIVMGYATLETLPLDAHPGWIYYAADDFVTDNRFVEGAGVEVWKGTRIYFTGQYKWTIMYEEDLAKKIFLGDYHIDNAIVTMQFDTEDGDIITEANSEVSVRTTVQKTINSTVITIDVEPINGLYNYQKVITRTETNGVININEQYTRTEKEEE